MQFHIQDGRSALRIAVDYGYLEAAQLLIRAGANPNLPDKNKVTPLIAAFQRRQRMATLESKKMVDILETSVASRTVESTWNST